MEHKIVDKYRAESIDGFPVKVLKSALQKYARRQHPDGPAVMALFDASGDSNPRRKSIRSVAVNRTICMMSEEVGICNPGLPHQLGQLYRQWIAKRESHVMMTMYQLVWESPKCRLISDLKTMFYLPPYYSKDQWKYSIQLWDLMQTPANLRVDSWLDEEDLMESISTALQEGSVSAFAMLGAAYRQGRKPYDMWKMVKQLPMDQDTKNNVCALFFLYIKMTHKERYIYLYHAMLLIILRKHHLCNQVDCTTGARTTGARRKSEDNPTAITKLEPWVYDMHCGEAKCNEVDFAMEGEIGRAHV